MIYTTVSFHVIYATSSVTLREEYRLRVLKKKVLGRVFGP